jgi:hypothetical protein
MPSRDSDLLERCRLAKKRASRPYQSDVSQVFPVRRQLQNVVSLRREVRQSGLPYGQKVKANLHLDAAERELTAIKDAHTSVWQTGALPGSHR